jgi:DNA (cytosine-5)-methyltransferase 1
VAHSAASLFTGAGGFDIGVERAGFEVVFRTDLDAACCETLVANGRPATLDDVRDVELPSGLDLVFGGPPCQAFSSAGSMGGLSDPRGQLVFEFARHVASARPRLFLMENVRGLVTARPPDGEPGGVLLALLAAFGSAGYACRAMLLNAADFGSPQRRVRLFIAGSRAGAPPKEPEPTHGLGRIPHATLGGFLALHADLDESAWERPTPALAAALVGVQDGHGLRSPGKVEATRPGGHWGYRQGAFIADQSLPARTVTATTSDLVRLPDGSLRRLTAREAAGLQGFPDGWEFRGARRQALSQAGNAVPVPLAEAVARAAAARLASWDESAPPEAAPLPERMRRDAARTAREGRRNRPRPAAER